MKRMFLVISALVVGLISFSQSTPNNVDVGLFTNGAHGSNSSSGANVEIALRIKVGGNSYLASPAADDFVMYFKVPKSDFALSDVVNIVQTNTAIYGASGTMTFQPLADIGDPGYYYFGIVLSSLGGMNLSSLNSVTNAWSFAYTISFTPTKTPAQYNNLQIVDQTNNAFLTAAFGSPTYTTLQMSSQNQLTPGAFSVLPVSLLNFSGYKNGTKNILQWTTASEQNNTGFDVQRSSNGVDYTSIGFVGSQAAFGNSSTELNYTFNDNSPAISKKQYYRLTQKDFDGRSKLSNIVLIKGDKSTEFMIDGLFPNPARDKVNVIVNAPQRDDVTLVVSDMTGKTVRQKLANVAMGSNTVQIDVADLASGSYLIKILCKSSDCETTTAKFNKQ